MKKRIVSLCIGALLTALTVCSCSKYCECVTYEFGIVTGTSIDTVWGQTCEEFSSVVETPDGKLGMECMKK